MADLSTALRHLQEQLRKTHQRAEHAESRIEQEQRRAE